MEPKKTVLITGATGFIGRALLRKLQDKNLDIIATYRNEKTYQERKIDRNNIVYSRLDLTDKNDFKKIPKRIDTVVHLAAQVFRADREVSFEDFFRSNILGAQNLLEFSIERNVKSFIYASTKCVYGEPKRKIVNEAYPAEPSGRFFHYGLSKLICEDLCKSYTSGTGIKTIIFRFSPVFGGDEEDTLLIPRLIKKIRDNREITLYGDGSNTMEYLHIDDCVEIIAKSLDSNYPEGTYNIGPGEPLTLKDIVDKILKVYFGDKSVTVHYDSKKGPIEKGFILDIKKAKENIGFKPVYSFEKGLNEFKEKRSDSII